MAVSPLMSAAPKLTAKSLATGSVASKTGQQGLTTATGNQTLQEMGPQFGLLAATRVSGAINAIQTGALEQSSYGLEASTTARQAALGAQSQGLEQGQYAITATQFPQQQEQTTQQYQLARQKAQDALAASGATNSERAKRTFSTLAANYGWNMADIYRKQQMATIGQKMEQVGFETKQASLANAQSKIATSAQQAGLTTKQYLEQTGFALKQMGISTTPTAFIAKQAQTQGTRAQTTATRAKALSLVSGTGG